MNEIYVYPNQLRAFLLQVTENSLQTDLNWQEMHWVT